MLNVSSVTPTLLFILLCQKCEVIQIVASLMPIQNYFSNMNLTLGE